MNDYIFSIGIVARHNSCRAEKIAAELEWEPYRSWSVGDDRVTPSGTRLPGIRKDTMCSFLHRYSDGDLNLAVAAAVEHLSLRKNFVRDHLGSGGTLAMNIGLNGQFHSGLVLPLQMLKAIGDLELQLSVECFPDG